MNKTLIKLLPILLVILACSRKNIPQSPSASTNLPSIKNSISDLRIKNTNFQNFTSRSNFNYKDNDENITATANLRMRKDSIIWINITPGLGIEAMRAIITPDSIVVVDKIKKRYVVYDFATLSRRYNFNLTYNLIQNLLLGNQVTDISDSSLVVKEGVNYVITQQIMNSLVESYINESSGKMEKVVFSEPGTSNQFAVSYKNIFENEAEKIIPNTISMVLDYTYEKEKYNVSILIDHLKTDFSEKELKFPFNIPAKYERVE